MEDKRRELTNSEILRYIQNFDEDFSFSDYTTEELFDLIDRFRNIDDFKEKYFDYYDDIKSMSRKRQDW